MENIFSDIDQTLKDIDQKIGQESQSQNPPVSETEKTNQLIQKIITKMDAFGKIMAKQATTAKVPKSPAVPKTQTPKTGFGKFADIGNLFKKAFKIELPKFSNAKNTVSKTLDHFSSMKRLFDKAFKKPANTNPNPEGQFGVKGGQVPPQGIKDKLVKQLSDAFKTPANTNPEGQFGVKGGQVPPQSIKDKLVKQLSDSFSNFGKKFSENTKSLLKSARESEFGKAIELPKFSNAKNTVSKTLDHFSSMKRLFDKAFKKPANTNPEGQFGVKGGQVPPQSIKDKLVKQLSDSFSNFGKKFSENTKSLLKSARESEFGKAFSERRFGDASKSLGKGLGRFAGRFRGAGAAAEGATAAEAGEGVAAAGEAAGAAEVIGGSAIAGPIGIAVGVTVVALGAFATALNKYSAVALENAKKIARFSGPLSAALQGAKIRQIGRDIQNAQAVGPAAAGYVNSQQNYLDAYQKTIQPLVNMANSWFLKIGTLWNNFKAGVLNKIGDLADKLLHPFEDDKQKKARLDREQKEEWAKRFKDLRGNAFFADRLKGILHHDQDPLFHWDTPKAQQKKKLGFH